jgi:hypothetical protein
VASHVIDIGPDPRRLGDHRQVDIGHAVAFFMNHCRGMLKEYPAVRAIPLRIRIREVLSYIALGDRPKEGVTERM